MKTIRMTHLGCWLVCWALLAGGCRQLHPTTSPDDGLSVEDKANNPPSGLVARSLSSSEIALSWTNGSTHQNGYQLERSLDGTTFSRRATLANGTVVYKDASLRPATAYHYRILAVDSLGNSRYSEIAHGTTRPLPLAGRPFRTVANGPWSSPATWDQSRVPGEGDTVTIAHQVRIDPQTGVAVGHSPGSNAGTAAVAISESGALTLGAGSLLACRGDLKAEGTVTLESGAVLEMDASHASGPASANYVIELKPGATAAHLQINGTANARCQVRASSAEAFAQITDGLTPDGGRIVASYCDFSNLGGRPGYRAWSYFPTSAGNPYRLQHCTFNRCSQIKASVSIPAGGVVAFVDCRFTSSVIKPYEERGLWEEWYLHETGAEPGASVQLAHCEFDRIIALFYYNAYEITDCVFRGGIKGYAHWAGTWKSFKRNFVRCQSDECQEWWLPGGLTLEDNVFIIDPAGCSRECAEISWNPHFLHMSAETGASILGNVWWWTGTDTRGEGDGVMVGSAASGTRAQNVVRYERNIILPNGNGPDGAQLLSMTPFTILDSTGNTQIHFSRNTAFTDLHGACNIGETNTAYAGDVGYMKSNLFIGSGNGEGYKVANLGHSQADAILARSADFNGGYRLSSGSNHTPGISGKGYHDLTFSGDRAIGAHDLDDQDPRFVDPTRTPATWDRSLGGAGTLEGAMNRLGPSGRATVENLLDYLREGFRPRNCAFHEAGDPEILPRPDLGAVDLVCP